MSKRVGIINPWVCKRTLLLPKSSFCSVTELKHQDPQQEAETVPAWVLEKFPGADPGKSTPKEEGFGEIHE